MVTNAHRDWLIGNALLIALLAAVAVCCLCGCGRDDSGRAEMLEGIIKRQTANIDELTADLSEVVKQRDDARRQLELYEKPPDLSYAERQDWYESLSDEQKADVQTNYFLNEAPNH